MVEYRQLIISLLSYLLTLPVPDVTYKVFGGTLNFALSIYLSLFVPYSTATRKNSGTGRTRLTALTVAIRNGKIKTKVVTSTSK